MDQSYDRFLHDEGYSESFRWHYLVPMTAALWSTAPGEVLGFPAAYGIDFFRNHSMLGLRPGRWRTVTGGSRVYVRALLDRLGAQMQLAAPVRSLVRTSSGVEVRAADGALRTFDGAVVATSAPRALALLEDASIEEHEILEAIAEAVAGTRLQINGVEEIGFGYARTLREWRLNVWRKVDRIRELGYDDRFLRIWTSYLAYCEAGFAIRSLRDMQIVPTHPANDSLPEFPAVRPTF